MRWSLLVAGAIVVGAGAANLVRAEPAPASPRAVTDCLGRLLAATGMKGDDHLDVGGDVDAVIIHQHDAEHPSRYAIFSPEGYFTHRQAVAEREEHLDHVPAPARRREPGPSPGG